ncbi:tetratricopeptide repeat protein [Streptomyces sp. BPSDS2]|uniref:tetratricopeptide repeat protein n=1 Tax=Streptomyces sp. BPSDS2 TaxID=2571021 RepID=UPI0010C1701D|nr:tetratricopeptide repeat protein [Streptomyces sp. BPSDS2]
MAMDVMPQQDPCARPAEGATAVPPPPPTLRTTLRRAAVGAVAAGVLLAGALVAVDDGEGDGPKEPGPVERAEAATTAGSPASLSDLTALIGDRQKWVESHPKDAPSLATLGTAYVEWARRSADTAYYARAEQALKRSLEAQPGEHGNGEAWVGLAALANARHDFLAAKRWGETVRKQQPKSWSVYPVLIDAYTGLGDQKAATAATEKFGELRKGVPALARTADLYRGQGWREDALAAAREAADRATQPAEKAEALHRLGELAWERGEAAEAVAQFDAALRTDAGHFPALAGRARALVALDRTDEASAAYQSALEQLPRPEYALELGELYESLGLDGDARTQYTKLREMVAEAKRAGADESLVLARFEADHGDPEAAVELLRAQWRGQHRSAAVADALGWALHRAGKSEEGLEYAERAVDTGVRNASYAYHLGVIQRELADYGPARRNLEQAVRTNPAFSPLAAPLAREALDALGEPPPGGPGDMQPPPPPPPAPEPKPEPKRETKPEAPAPAASRTADAPAKSPSPTASPTASPSSSPSVSKSP